MRQVTINAVTKELTYISDDGSYIEVGAMPDSAVVDTILAFCKSYKSPEVIMQEELIELAIEANPDRAKELLPTWKPGEQVYPGNYRVYEGVIYQVAPNGEHITQDNWVPTRATNLWLRRGTTEEIDSGETPAWAPGMYAKGDIRVHNGKTWESQVDNNVWEPGAPGVYENIWKEVL